MTKELEPNDGADGCKSGRDRHVASDARPERGMNSAAQTFRRGRAVAFLERLQGMRATLARQLREPEFESIRPVISGELKAIETIIQAFAQTFELQDQAGREPQRAEAEAVFANSKTKENEET